MPATITAGELAVAIRAAAAEDSVPDAVMLVLGFMRPAAMALVEEYAPEAPVDIQNAAVIRVAGWLYDADPAEPRIGRVMEISGAANLLARWRVHRAGAIGGEAAAIAPASGLPPIPESGSFILSAENGELAWLAFPRP